MTRMIRVRNFPARLTPNTTRYPPLSQRYAPILVPTGPPRLLTKWTDASLKVLCSGLEISVMKEAMPMLKEMWPPDMATGRLTENRRYSLGQDIKYEFRSMPPLSKSRFGLDEAVFIF